MRFPLADWIDGHAACRFNLGGSGMAGTVRYRRPTPADLRRASEAELRAIFARRVGVDPDRVFLTHGATEANALAVTYLARRRRARSARARVALPEYPPLVDLARAAGYRVGETPGSCDLAIVSQPHNPVGDFWPPERFLAWNRGARATVVDETFREFTPARSLQRLGLPGLWTTGSLTKAYGADDLRVGYVVAPEREQRDFARFHGLVADEMPPYSVAGAIATLSDAPRILGEVRAVVARNQALWRRARPEGPPLAAPVAFDEPVPLGGDRFARACLRASILVSPGRFFGRPRGVRVGMTRRGFPAALRAYLAVRARLGARGRR